MDDGLVPGGLDGVLLDHEIKRLHWRRVLQVLAVNAERQIQLNHRLAGARAHHVHVAPHVRQLRGEVGRGGGVYISSLSKENRSHKFLFL